ETAAVVAAAAHGDPQVVLLPVPDRRRDVALVDAVGDRGRPLVDHRVEEGPRLVVVGRTRLDDTALHGRRKALDRNSHLSPPLSLGGDATTASCEMERCFGVRFSIRAGALPRGAR